MSYYFSKEVEGSFEEAIERVKAKLETFGFGVLTDIDVQATLKKKINVDFYKYRILGACNPPYAYKALQAEDKIGIMLPCNVIVQQKESGGKVEVSAVDPISSMQAVSNPDLGRVAQEIQGMLKQVISEL